MAHDESRMDSKSQMDIVSNEDTALITMAQELDVHTSQLRKSVLDTVRLMRAKIATQATEMIDTERSQSREQERRLLSQIDSLQRLLDSRSRDLESERALNERLVSMVQAQRRRQRTKDLAAEGLRRWHAHVTEKKRREKMCDHLMAVKKDKEARHAFNAWRFEATRQKHEATVDKLTGDFKRQLAKAQSEHQTMENATKLEMLSMKESLAKEEERRAVLEERLKAAFMRGVCALNMEAMQVLRNAPQDGDVSVASLLQAMNLTSSTVDSNSAEPASTDRLLRQQEILQAQLNEMHAMQHEMVPQEHHHQQHHQQQQQHQHQRAAAVSGASVTRNVPLSQEPKFTVTVNPNHPSLAHPSAQAATRRPLGARPATANTRRVK